MTEQKLQIIMQSLAKYTMSPLEVEEFHLSLIDKKYRAEHCRYVPMTGKEEARIDIFQPRRPGMEILMSAIHGTAHHILFCDRGSEKHSKRFFRIQYELTNSAVRLGYLDYEQVAYLPTCRMMYEICGAIQAEFGAEIAINKSNESMYVDNHRCIKETRNIMVELGFIYSPAESLWELNAGNQKIDSVRDELSKLKCRNLLKVKTLPFTTVFHNPVIAVIVTGNTYEYRNVLKDHGYYFSNGWKKKIHASEFKFEKKQIEKLNGLSLMEVEL